MTLNKNMLLVNISRTGQYLALFFVVNMQLLEIYFTAIVGGCF